MEKIVIILFPVLLALLDGFYDNKKKLTSSIFKTLFLGVCASFLLFDLNGWHIVYLALCYWVLFDITYNIIRRQGIFYVGNTKWTDKLLRLIARTNAPYLSAILKLMAIAGIFALFYTGRL